MAEQVQFSDLLAYQGLASAGQYAIFAPIGLGQTWTLARMNPNPAFLGVFSDAATAMAASQGDLESLPDINNPPPPPPDDTPPPEDG